VWDYIREGWRQLIHQLRNQISPIKCKRYEFAEKRFNEAERIGASNSTVESMEEKLQVCSSIGPKDCPRRVLFDNYCVKAAQFEVSL
jgi:hypothetical protein